MYTNFLKTQSADGSRNMGMNVIDAKDGDNTSFFFSVLKSYCFRTHRDCFFPIILSLNIPYEIVVHLSCFLCLPSFSSATFFPFEKKIEEKQTNTSMKEKKEKKSRMEPFFYQMSPTENDTLPWWKGPKKTDWKGRLTNVNSIIRWSKQHNIKR